MKLGLLGKNISYSFSQQYFTDKFNALGLKDYSYSVFDMQEEKEIPSLFATPDLLGFNVTTPYKEVILTQIDELSPEAQKIGAVNTVKIVGNKKIGYNTDAVGFENSLLPLLKTHHTSALVLGTGGASKAVAYVLDKLNIDWLKISRTGENNYASLSEEVMSKHTLIINTTPVGTFPNIEDSPAIPYEYITEKHLCYDLVYNPKETKFLSLAKAQGAEIKSGLEMLHLQAEEAWRIWNDK